MIKFILFLFSVILLSNFNCFASESASRGYLALYGESVFYYGFNDDGVDIQLGPEVFSEEEFSVMLSCMEKKATHAILLETGTKKIEVPSDIPNSPTFFHEIYIKGVDCVRAPGYLTLWQGRVNK